MPHFNTSADGSSESWKQLNRDIFKQDLWHYQLQLIANLAGAGFGTANLAGPGAGAGYG